MVVGSRRLLPIVIVLLSLSVASVMAQTAAPDKFQFRGAEVKRLVGTYLVTKDVNVRAKPMTGSKRVGRYKRGDRIQVVGRAKGAWVAVREDGKDFGFVYEPILMPLIDGTLTDDLSGHLKAKESPACDYRIHFAGRSPAQGTMFDIADYEVTWECAADGRKLKFYTPMFMTEGPYQVSKKPVYQITIDFLGLDSESEEIFSSTVLYNKEKGQIIFDSVNMNKYGRKPTVKEWKVKTAPDALNAAVRIVYGAWGNSLWADLGKSLGQ